MHIDKGRLGFLDGLRGVSVIGVVISHAYGDTFANFLPFGLKYSMIYPVRFGGFGVELFFLISGFVILMTLERCDGVIEFGKRRWLRLFPAMLVISALILAFDYAFGVGPNADRSFVNLVPGYLFVSPSLIHALTRLDIASMDSPYWTLYIEVCFYALFGASYFWLGCRKAITVIFGLYACCIAAWHLASLGVGGFAIAEAASTMHWLGFAYFGWFAAGAVFYRAFRTSDRRTLILGVAMSFASTLTLFEGIGSDAMSRIALLLVSVLFTASITWRPLRLILENRVLLFFGFVSYPLYLVHNQIMIGMVDMLASTAPWMPSALMPVGPIAIVVVMAWLVARTVEPPLKGYLARALMPSIKKQPRTVELDSARPATE